MITLIIAAFAGFVWLEVPMLVDKKYWRELVAYAVLMAVAFALCILYALGASISDPFKYVIDFIKSLVPFSYE